MTNKLQQYFPMLKSREEVIEKIKSDPTLEHRFNNWKPEKQEEFLDFCTGVWGGKTMYDFMSKEILNPETTPERLNDFLSNLLEQKVRILSVLPNDSVRIADESSLLVTDIVVELEDGSIANIEIQRIGYAFPGERSACYSADLLLRQYKRVRSRQKEKFSYKDIKNVYTIVLFENSTRPFHDFPDIYIHSFKQISNTGLQFNLLQKYIFIPLDIFRKIFHNKSEFSKLDAWLAFLSMDDPETILSIINSYPEFEPIYRQIFDFCQNIERGIEVFSEELRILDRNTVQYMIDEMQDTINQQAAQLSQINEKLSQKDEQLSQKDEQLSQLTARINVLEHLIESSKQK